MKTTGWFVVIAAATLCLTATACSNGHTQPQEGIAGRLETAAAAKGPPSYFLGRSYAGIPLTTVEAAGSKALEDGERTYVEYGTCEYEDDSGCSPPIQVRNLPRDLGWISPSFCEHQFDVRGVPAVTSEGIELLLYTGDSTVEIYKGATNSPGGDLRGMAMALRPVSGPADVTKPLPPPAKDVLEAIATTCG